MMDEMYNGTHVHLIVTKENILLHVIYKCCSQILSGSVLILYLIGPLKVIIRLGKNYIMQLQNRMVIFSSYLSNMMLYQGYLGHWQISKKILPPFEQAYYAKVTYSSWLGTGNTLLWAAWISDLPLFYPKKQRDHLVALSPHVQGANTTWPCANSMSSRIFKIVKIWRHLHETVLDSIILWEISRIMGLIRYLCVHYDCI